MSRRIRKIADNEIPGERFWFHCPGCDHAHCVITPNWTWNGSYELPTFNPSVLVQCVGEAAGEERCHSYIKDGKIQFLNDCWHNLKGQTVDLPDLDFLDDGDWGND